MARNENIKHQLRFGVFSTGCSPRPCSRSVVVSFPKASERRVLLKAEVCYTSSHAHIFTSSHVHILTSSHLHKLTTHILTSSYLHKLTSFTSSHLLLTFTYSHLRIFTHLHIFLASHPHIRTSSHIFTHLHTSLSLSLALCHGLSPSFSFPSFFSQGRRECRRGATILPPFRTK